MFKDKKLRVLSETNGSNVLSYILLSHLLVIFSLFLFNSLEIYLSLRELIFQRDTQT